MKKLLPLAALAAALINPMAAEPVAPAKAKTETTIETSVRLTDAYSAARGFKPSSQTAVQPVVNIYHGPFSVEYWGTGGLYKKGFKENDFGAFIQGKIADTAAGPIEARGGYQNFLDDFLFYQEVQGKVALNGKVRPAVFFAHDFTKAGHGQYFEPSIGTAMTLPGVHKTAEFTVSGMYNRHYAVNTTGWTGFKIEGRVPLKTYENGTVVSLDGKYFHATSPSPDIFRSHANVGLTISHKGTLSDIKHHIKHLAR